MSENKYNKVLTVLFVLVVISIIILLCFLGYDYYKNYTISKDASDYVDDYKEEKSTPEDNNEIDTEKNDENQGETTNEGTVNNSKTDKSETKSNNKTYKQITNVGNIVGTMEIPKINFKYPVYEKATKKALEKAVAVLYGSGLNKAGNTIVVGHNNRNKLFFSNNKKLENGDKIYVTDSTGTKLTYTVYNKFETTPNDASFYTRDTAGKPELTLSTCTDDGNSRLIIFAKIE